MALRQSRPAATLLALTLGACQYVLDFGQDPGALEEDAPPAIDARIQTDAVPRPACENGLQDGEETAPDCGGPSCSPCDTGAACLEGRDCLSGACAYGVCEDYPRGCSSIHDDDPAIPSGVTTIDVDASGPAEPITVYCEQTLMGGGWQLVSVVPQGGVTLPGATAPVPFVGFGYCASATVPCGGQIHPAQVSAAVEIAVLDDPTGDYLILRGWAATAGSALRFFSMERMLSNSDVCTDPHVCGSAALDPDLTLTTSGYPMAYNAPLIQWWRLGGWYIGAGPVAGSMDGNVFRTSYGFNNALSTRATPDGLSTVRANGDQRVFLRVPPVPSAPVSP